MRRPIPLLLWFRSTTTFAKYATSGAFSNAVVPTPLLLLSSPTSSPTLVAHSISPTSDGSRLVSVARIAACSENVGLGSMPTSKNPTISWVLVSSMTMMLCCISLRKILPHRCETCPQKATSCAPWRMSSRYDEAGKREGVSYYVPRSQVTDTFVNSTNGSDSYCVLEYRERKSAVCCVFRNTYQV